ncbi:MAG TPA: DUF456 domain-containing protein [Gemmatimonadales bacterium]
MALLLLLSTFLAAGLLLIPFGLPGLWLMAIGVVAYGWLTDFHSVSVTIIAVVIGLAGVAEIAEAWVGFRFAKRYGGSSRAGWGALVGGLVGAVIGVPIPIIGSVIGGFAGAFAGAAFVEYAQQRRAEAALGAGWGALLGRAAAVAVKMGLGVVIAVVSLFAALR